MTYIIFPFTTGDDTVIHLTHALRALPRYGWPATEARLADGAQVTLRDARADAPRLRALFYTLSDTTRYLYFCAGVPQNDAWAEKVAQLGVADGCASYALVAEVAGSLVGVARFDRAADSSRAEIGILLTDAWQSRGLGREVVARLRAEATRRALTGFTATVLGDNRRAMRLLRRAFPTMQATWSYGQFTLDLPFTDVPAPASER
ncbi:MAG TPA: GNAT family N-acetyltransferase [Ktedonobacterales bacterium]|nr:GNAT family N-acetyltransferase [Ktedonobacterales bacterium]